MLAQTHRKTVGIYSLKIQKVKKKKMKLQVNTKPIQNTRCAAPKSERIYNSTVKKFNAFQNRAQPCGGFLVPTGNSYADP